MDDRNCSCCLEAKKSKLRVPADLMSDEDRWVLLTESLMTEQTRASLIKAPIPTQGTLLFSLNDLPKSQLLTVILQIKFSLF